MIETIADLSRKFAYSESESSLGIKEAKEEIIIRLYYLKKKEKLEYLEMFLETRWYNDPVIYFY